MRLYGLRLQDSGAGCESFLIMMGTCSISPPQAADPIQQAESGDRHRQARVSDP
jgi:hypothetical protein